MGIMKGVYDKLIAAFPNKCPNCGAELCDQIDFEQLNQVLDEVSAIAEENARRKAVVASRQDSWSQRRLQE
jgi:hypothetical protein